MPCTRRAEVVTAAAKRSEIRALGCLSGGGEMGALMRSIDWSTTPLGPVTTWSETLRAIVSMMLANSFPMLLWWGPDYVQLYNDAYCPIPGTKHPRSMGQAGRDCWPEIWHILRPLIDRPFNGGPATWMDDILLVINRHGYLEETHFTIAYSPVPDETAPRGIGGVLATVHEITEKVVGERRIAALRDLGARAAEVKSAEDACAVAAQILANNAKDVPFALLYLIEGGGQRARLAGAAGIGMGEAASPLVVELGDGAAGWPLSDAIERKDIVLIEDLQDRFAEVPQGPWPDPPRSAVVVPVRSQKANELAALLVAGVSSRLRFDELYRSFFDLVASQVATTIANARAYEEERRRAEALAAIDRAKTAFFSNVSHEFRTPLTLMLGPLEDALAAPPENLPGHRDDLALVHRNSLRLLRLVNTLLDFSRIEAGRVQASFAPVDLARYTAELASVFRAATDKAGLRFEVDCGPLGEPVWVDREMWEKIVLNLISNAFKFTFEGGIRVRLGRKGASAVLEVEDTGTGIPEHEIPHLFDRFHRVEGARGRTHEGTGIGLALVQELARLHGGTVRAESVHGAGSTFTVTVPLGTAHLPPERMLAEPALASTAVGAQTYIEEALRWLPEEGGSAESGIERPLLPEEPLPAPAGEKSERATILVADDNADMRDYVRHLLGARYEVRAVADGEQALEALRAKLPDLLLSDVMMPRMTGFELLRAVRSDPALAKLPVIFLSARAGEEASIEGLEAGADDYLVKPFSARELMARVTANLEMARARRAAEQALRQAYRETVDILESIDDAFFAVDDDWRVTYVNRRAEALWAKRREDVVAKKLWDIFPSAVGSPFHDAMHQALRERRVVECDAYGPIAGTWLSARFYPGRSGLTAYLRDTGEQRKVQEMLRQTQAHLQAVFDDAPVGIYLVDGDLRIREVNPTALPVFGAIPDLIGRDFAEVIHTLWRKDYADEVVRVFRHTLETGEPYFAAERAQERLDRGVTEYYEWRVSRVPLPEGRYGVVCYFRDVSVQVLARHAIAASEQRFRFMAESMPQKIFTAKPDGAVDYFNRQWVEFTGLAVEQSEWTWWTRFLHPDDLTETLRLWRRSIETGEPFQLMHRFRRADGVHRWHLTRVRAMHDPLGRISMWIGSNTDIHEQKETEAAFRELNDTLERKVAERSRALEAEVVERQKAEMALQQAQRLEAIGQLTGGVAHDFNNLLTIVLGQVESIMAVAKGDKRITRMAASAQRAAERGAQLTSQLLAFSRRQPLQPRTIAMDRLLANIGELVRRAVGEAVALEVSAAPRLWPAHLDPAQFEAAVLNLAINARDAMPKGGRLTIEARNATVDAIEAQRLDLAPGAYNVLSVADTGVGMSPDVQRHAFEPFFTTKDVGKGTGLGLAQVYGFVKQSGGAAAIESAAGGGTRVVLYLPKAKTLPAEDEPLTRDKAPVAGRGRTILVVDDQSEIRDVIEMCLADLGYRIIEAADGVAAKKLLESDETIDLLLTDVVMPNGVSGLDLAKEARRLRQDLRVILVSGYLRGADGRAGDLSGVIFLEKPFKQAELAEAVAAALADGKPGRRRAELRG